MTKEKRNRRGGGSVYQLADGRWQGQISLGHAGGKRVRRTVSGATAKEVQSKLRNLQRDVERGVPVPSSSMRVSEYLESWLSSKKHEISPSTYRSYAGIVRNHISPELGNIRLNKLTQHDVNAMLTRKIEAAEKAAIQRETARPGDKLVRFSVATVDGIRRVLRAALNDALRDDHVGRNVAALSKPPKVPHFEGKALTRREAESFLNTIDGARYELLYRVALSVGLRQGEILGLRWRDVDFEDGTISIRKQLQRVDGVLQLRDLKTITSRRTIPLPATMMKALKSHGTEQKAERLKAGGKWQGERWQLVFMTPLGTPIDDANLRKDFRKRLADAGLEHMRFHDLRHSAGSFMAAQGVHVKEAQRILGHAQVTTTLQVYTHAQLDNMRDALERVGDYLDTPKEAENDAI